MILNKWYVEKYEEGFILVHYVGGEDPEINFGGYADLQAARKYQAKLNAIAFTGTFVNVGDMNYVFRIDQADMYSALENYNGDINGDFFIKAEKEPEPKKETPLTLAERILIDLCDTEEKTVDEIAKSLDHNYADIHQSMYGLTQKLSVFYRYISHRNIYVYRLAPIFDKD